MHIVLMAIVLVMLVFRYLDRKEQRGRKIFINKMRAELSARTERLKG